MLEAFPLPHIVGSRNREGKKKGRGGSWSFDQFAFFFPMGWGRAWVLGGLAAISLLAMTIQIHETLLSEN